MQSRYQELFLLILDKDKPNPVIIVNNPDHLPAVRAGLNRCRQDYITLASLVGGNDLTNKRFSYNHNKDDPSKVTISIVDTPKVDFSINK